jgi:ribosomal protein L34E
LERHGVGTSQGAGTWSRQALKGLLASRVYRGELSYGRDRRFVNPDAHEAIVDEPTWQAAQRSPTRPTSVPKESLLAGILRCATCGYSMQATNTSRGKRIYRCVRRHAGGQCPAPARVGAECAEALVLDLFWEQAREAAAGRIEAGEDPVREAQANYERAERAYVQWRDDAEAADEDYAEYRARLRVLRERRDTRAEELAEARARVGKSIDLVALEEAWANMSTRERRDEIAHVLDLVAVRRDPLRLEAWPAGSGPLDLPRRGYVRGPRLRPLRDTPAGARVATL